MWPSVSYENEKKHKKTFGAATDLLHIPFVASNKYKAIKGGGGKLPRKDTHTCFRSDQL